MHELNVFCVGKSFGRICLHTWIRIWYLILLMHWLSSHVTTMSTLTPPMVSPQVHGFVTSTTEQSCCWVGQGRTARTPLDDPQGRTLWVTSTPHEHCQGQPSCLDSLPPPVCVWPRSWNSSGSVMKLTRKSSTLF